MYVTEIKKMEFQYIMHKRRHEKNYVAAALSEAGGSANNVARDKVDCHPL